MSLLDEYEKLKKTKPKNDLVKAKIMSIESLLEYILYTKKTSSQRSSGSRSIDKLDNVKQNSTKKTSRQRSFSFEMI